MSYPILYSATETKYDHNGIGILSACVSCEVTEEGNGIFELAMQYPMDGVHFAEICDRAIIKAKADQFRDPQLFRVYAISKPMNGIVTVLAEHISYDLSGIPVKPFSAPTASSALAGLKSNAVVDCPFEFWTDKDTAANFKVSVPASIRSRLGGVAGSILDVYGGEYEFDNYTVKLHNNRGTNRGVSIRYGKNLTDIQQEQNCSAVATGVYPYWTDINGENIIELPERIINASGTYNFVKIKTLDLSQVFLEQPTLEQIRNYTQKYIDGNNIGVPVVSLSVSFAQLEQSEEYKHLKLLERVSLFDAVNVEFPALGVSANAKVVKMVYDVLSDRVKLATLGSVRANIADTIVEQAKEIEKAKKPNFLQNAVENATQWITNGKGYMVAVKDENGNWKEICSLDTPDIDAAVNVWRWNNGGFGFSPNGYGGPYETAITQDGQIVADFITVGSLTASIIKAGILKSVDSETFYLDLENGILKMKATDFSISGKTVDEISQEKANAAEDNAVKKAEDLANTAEQNAINTASSDATNKADIAENNAKNYADSAAVNAVNAQTQTDIFNKLTNNGELPGLFMKDGQLYINASYLATGVISSADGKISIDLTGKIPEPVFNTGISTNGLTVRADEAGAKKLIGIQAKTTSSGVSYGQAEFYGVNGNQLAVLSEVFGGYGDSLNPVGVSLHILDQDGYHEASIDGSNNTAGFHVYIEGFDVGSFVATGSFMDGSARSELWTDVINEKSISWEYVDELGKYVLCGE